MTDLWMYSLLVPYPETYPQSLLQSHFVLSQYWILQGYWQPQSNISDIISFQGFIAAFILFAKRSASSTETTQHTYRGFCVYWWDQTISLVFFKLDKTFNNEGIYNLWHQVHGTISSFDELYTICCVTFSCSSLMGMI